MMGYTGCMHSGMRRRAVSTEVIMLKVRGNGLSRVHAFGHEAQVLQRVLC